MAAIARLSECDDIHLGSCVTPGAVVIPVALAFADDHSEDTITRAISAGYAAGIGLGTAIGGARALARGVWPTLAAAPVMAAATASCLISGDPERLAHAIALALPYSNVRVVDPSLRWTPVRVGRLAWHASSGSRAPRRARRSRSRPGQCRRRSIRERAPRSQRSGSSPFRSRDKARTRWSRFSACCPRDRSSCIDAIEVFVPAINIALLNRAISESDRLSRLCNMGLQLAAAALAPDLLYDPERIVQGRRDGLRAPRDGDRGKTISRATGPTVGPHAWWSTQAGSGSKRR